MPRAAQPAILASTLERGMRVLSLFRTHLTPLSLSEIAQHAELEKSAAQRLTYTLHALGYLERDEKTRRYRPGLRTLDLAYGYLIHDRLLERALPHMIELSRKTRTTVNLAVLDGSEVIYKARIPRSSLSYDAALIGVRQPAQVTGIGQAIAAFSPPEVTQAFLAAPMPAPQTPFTCQDPDEIRARVESARHDGFVITSQQILLQEIVVSAPVFRPRRQAVAGISMPVYMPDWSVERAREDLVPALTEAARTISTSVARL